MSESREIELCRFCRKNRAEKQAGDGGICPECAGLAQLIQTRPELVKKLWRHYQDEPILIGARKTDAGTYMELPDVLDGKRYRTVDREHNKWYLSISELDGNPVEVFASTAFDRDHELQSRISNLTTITRLISLMLRHIFLGEPLTLKKCLKQIKRSSRQRNDLPDMLYGVLSRYDRQEPEPREETGQDTP